MSPAESEASRHDEPGTFAGGSAGFAGVGRRGFAAAARAALFAIPTSPRYEATPPPNGYLDTDSGRCKTHDPASRPLLTT